MHIIMTGNKLDRIPFLYFLPITVHPLQLKWFSLNLLFVSFFLQSASYRLATDLQETFKFKMPLNIWSLQ